MANGTMETIFLIHFGFTFVMIKVHRSLFASMLLFCSDTATLYLLPHTTTHMPTNCQVDRTGTGYLLLWKSVAFQNVST